MTTSAGLKSKIESAGLGDTVADWMFKDKLTYAEIVRLLKDNYNIELCEASISRFKNTIVKKMVPEFLRQDKEYHKNLAKKYLNTIEQLIFTLEEINTKIKEFSKNPKKWRQHSTYLSLALQQLNLLLKRSGEIRPSQFIEKQEINMVQINQVIQTEIVRLIDNGDIELKHCSENIQNFYNRIKAKANANLA